jgi:DNA-directed RNA polymerase specialized sigma24 family protein
MTRCGLELNRERKTTLLGIDMTEEENTIDLVSSELASKFTFGYYEPADIYQEAFIIGLEVLDKYDPNKGAALKTFLTTCIVRRLINLKSYEYFKAPKDWDSKSRLQLNENKKKLIDTAPLEVDMSTYQHPYEDVDNKEISDYVNEHLEYRFRMDYKKILAGLYVNKPRRDQIMARVQELYDEAMSEQCNIKSK